MAKFSLRVDEGSAGPSNPKRQRTEPLMHTDDEEEEAVEEDEDDDDEDDDEEEEVEREEEEYEEEGGDEDEIGEVQEFEDEEDGREQNQAQEVGCNGDHPESSRRLAAQGSSHGIERHVSQKPVRDDAISVILADPDVLDCAICLEPLNAPVFQCENGHTACSSCCLKLRNKCPSCSWPIGYNRCRAIERVLDSVKISCQYAKHGCSQIMSYSNKHEHEKKCIYEPCSCPFPDCNFTYPLALLSVHIRSKHSDSVKHFSYNRGCRVFLKRNDRLLILHEQDKGELFTLRNSTDILGNVVSLSCVRPNSLKRIFSYDLVAVSKGSSLRLRSTTESTPGHDEFPRSTGFLLVPSSFLASIGQLELNVFIRHKDATH